MDTQDLVDKILNQWQRERSDLDVSPMGIIGRISRLSRHFETHLKPVFDKYGINSGEFDVLATLRRSGEPYQLTPTLLFKSVMLTSGAMTNRLNRLENRGLIIRSADPDDRRGTIVSLTPLGLELIDSAIEDHVLNEHKLLKPYTALELTELAPLLRKLLIYFEDDQHEL